MSEGVTKQPGEMMQACMGMMEGMREEADKGMCPMASMCKGMMEKTGLGLLLLIPGAALILGGILILIDPNILFWLLAGTSMALGLAMSGFAIFIHKMGGGFKHMHG